MGDTSFRLLDLRENVQNLDLICSQVGWIAKGGHWGGYTYRLCKLPKEGKTGLTEECFAK